MLDQNAFRETLHLVQEVAAALDHPMSREEVLYYFRDMELDEEQKELVYGFVCQPAGKKAPARENSTAHFQMYMQEVSGISRLDQEQEQQLYQRLLAGDGDVIEAISRQWLSRIVTMAREYQSDRFCLDDLVQEGNMGLLMALHEYLGQRDTRELEKRLVEAVMDALEAFVGAESGCSQQEETILAKVSLLHEAKKFLMDQSGEEPTLEELADYTRLSLQEINDIMELMEKARRPS